MTNNLRKKGMVYRHFDKDGNLLYVGMSMNPFKRLGGHRFESIWFDRIVKITIERYPTKWDAITAERRAIRNENPQFNKSVLSALTIERCYNSPPCD